MKSIEQIPQELHQEILLYLQIIDLIPLRLVCKLWDKIILKIMELKSREYTKYEPGYLINFGSEYPWYQQIKLKKLIDSGNEKGLKEALSHPHAVISRDLFFYSKNKKTRLHKLIEEKANSEYKKLYNIYLKYCLKIPEESKNLPESLGFSETWVYSLIYNIIHYNIENKDLLFNILTQSKISLKILPEYYKDIIEYILDHEKVTKLEDSYDLRFVLRFMNHIIKLEQHTLDKLLYLYGQSRFNFPAFTEFLLKLGADVNSIYNNNDSLLCTVIKTYGASHVEKLLSLGADPNELSKNHSPLYYAISYANDYEIAEILIKHGAKILETEKPVLIEEYKSGKIKINIEGLEAKHGDLCAKPIEQPDMDVDSLPKPVEQPAPQQTKWCWML